jgi:hypothetical protein
MQTSYPKYKIKPGDTIERLTQLFGFERSVWLRYHNDKCRMEHVIRNKIPPAVREIYLLPELWDKADFLNAQSALKEVSEKRIRQKVEFGYEKTLPMKACYETLHYGVMLTLFNAGTANTIKCERSVRWLKKEDKRHLIEVDNPSGTYINDREPDLVFDVLAVKAASALYPLELIVMRAEGIIGIHNLSAIRKRWENVRLQIRKYYEGDTLEKYLRLHDKTLQNEDALLRSLHNDWFLHAYFNKIYQTYGENHSFSNIISVPFIFDAKEIEYTVKQNIHPIVDERGYIKIEMKGNFSDKRSVVDLESGLNYAQYPSIQPLGNYCAQYLLESKCHTIDTLTVDCSLDLSKGKKTSIVVSRINKRES